MSMVGTPLALNEIAGGRVMGNYILVPLDPSDQIEKIMPRLEAVAHTGMTVIFLIPYQANGFFKNRRIRAELSSNDIPTGRNALMKYSYEKQTLLADENVSVVREALQGRGIEVIAYVYTDSLRTVLKRYRRNGGVHRVIERKTTFPMIRIIHGIITRLLSFERYCGEFRHLMLKGHTSMRRSGFGLDKRQFSGLPK
jgi:hypothetical protein